MGVRSGGRKLSFDILTSPTADDFDSFIYRTKSDTTDENGGSLLKRKTKGSKKKKKNKKKLIERPPVSESAVLDGELLRHLDGNSVKEGVFGNGFCSSCSSASVVVFERVVAPPEEGEESVCTVSSVTGGGGDGGQEVVSFHGRELRQRSVGNGGGTGSEELLVVPASSRSDENENVKEESSIRSGIELVDSPLAKQPPEPNGTVGRPLEKDKSLDWKRLMAEDHNHTFLVEKSPLKYFMEEMHSGNSLRNTTTIGNDKERERVYDTIFRLPWRCELLIDIGFFVCMDSFLSLLTIMPIRLVTTLWKFMKTRQFKRPSAAEVSDFGCFLVLAVGVALLQQADISLIYHMIRGQGTIKLYVVYNVLEIFDKLCQSFGGDVMQTLFNSTEGLVNCSQESMGYWLWRFISDEALAVGSSVVHSFILLAQAITLSTCIVAHNNALLALLVSNNFAEIKSNVFKRFSKDNIHSLVYYDSVERFHISAFVLFVLAQNILEAEGPWFESFLCNALLVYVCEMMIDVIKHSFIAKFNDIKPIVFSEFLEDLCKQTLNLKTENGKKNLTFVPLAPACVVIRVMSPVFAAHLPYGPLPWRLFWIFLLSAMTFVMLGSLKMLIGMGLQKHATWYVNRCRRRKLHSD